MGVSLVHRIRRSLLIAATAWFVLTPAAHALNVQRLKPSEIATLQAVLKALEPSITAKKQDGTANVLPWDELYAPLSPEQRAFLDAFRKLKAVDLGATSHYFGESSAAPELIPVGTQGTIKDGKTSVLDPQYLPKPVLEAYQRMMAAMQTDLGKQLLIESGYRSPAYQLYLFLYYMPKHGYSIIETNKFVALPGHSEHGYPPRQAIDFINQEGINGEDRPEEFEALPEYQWLQQHAREYDFLLSYPRDNPDNTAFEPWHWHYESSDK